MTHHAIRRLILRVGFFVFIFSFAAILKPAMAQCDKPDDVRIVTNITAKIAADRILGPQKGHINVISVNGAVKLQGWTETRTDYERLYDIPFKEPCVTMVNVNGFSQTPPAADSPMRAGSGCGTGLKACGDVCIPSGDTCSITSNKSGE